VVSEQSHLPPLLLSYDKGIITNNTIVQQTPDAEKQSHNYSRANSACLHAACRTVTETMNRDRRGVVLRCLHSSSFRGFYLFFPYHPVFSLLLTLLFSPSVTSLHPDLLVSKSLFQNTQHCARGKEETEKSTSKMCLASQGAA